MTVGSQKIVIPGGSGFIGSHLARHFSARGAEVVILSRGEEKTDDNSRTVWWDGANLDTWAEELDGADVVINLAGRTVNCRYGKRNRQQIYDSREFSTQVIGEAIAQARRPPGVWFNASSATVYRHALDRPMDEATGEVDKVEPGKPRDKWEFSVDVVNRWEAALFAAATPATRRIAMRLPMVFGPGRGGVYEAFRNIARLGLGGTQGPGNQYVSWLHVDDLLRIINWCIEHETLEGAINMLMAPSRVSCSMHQLIIRNKSSTCSQLTYWLPGPCVPPRPKRAMFRNASYTPPLPGPKTIGSRMAIRRVAGVAAANNAASQRFTTSTENSHLSRGLPGSTLSTSPVASSIGRSSACRYTVAELALNHTPGGRLAWAMASPITCVENSRES